MAGVKVKANKALERMELSISNLKASVSKMDDTFSKGGDLNTPFLTTMKDCLKEAADVADKYAVESTTVKQLQTEVARQLEGKASRKIDYYKKAVPKATNRIVSELESKKRDMSESLREKRR